MSKFRLAIYIIALFIGLAVVYALFTQVRHVGRIRLQVNVAPSSAKIYIDGQISTSPAYLSRGSHTVEAKLSGFQAASKAIVLSKPSTISLALDPNSDVGTNYLLQHPEAQKQLEAQGGSYFQQASDNIAQYQQIVSQLPYDGIVFTVNYGEPNYGQNPKPGQIDLIVDGTNADARRQAISWIREQSVDPAKIHIEFVNTVNPFASKGDS